MPVLTMVALSRKTALKAEIKDMTSLTLGESLCSMSSKRPAREIGRAAKNRYMKFIFLNLRAKIARAIAHENKIANPPTRGTGSLWIF